jgi:hypothetical protein
VKQGMKPFRRVCTIIKARDDQEYGCRNLIRIASETIEGAAPQYFSGLFPRLRVLRIQVNVINDKGCLRILTSTCMSIRPFATNSIPRVQSMYEAKEDISTHLTHKHLQEKTPTYLGISRIYIRPHSFRSTSDQAPM